MKNYPWPQRTNDQHRKKRFSIPSSSSCWWNIRKREREREKSCFVLALICWLELDENWIGRQKKKKNLSLFYCIISFTGNWEGGRSGANNWFIFQNESVILGDYFVSHCSLYTRHLWWWWWWWYLRSSSWRWRPYILIIAQTNL